MRRNWINLGALAVTMLGGWLLVATPAHAAERAKCTIGNVTVEGDVCWTDGTTCKCS
ncbi:MAG TPA: hypothetical protein VK399_19530 [Longimicrobiaceae bacterium]|jgi:hypothetical protein|nr:hypothetical protein [Longimicrobiaceae bacterium]